MRVRQNTGIDELERLKAAMEAEPMAVLVMPWPKRGCRECYLCFGIDEDRNMVDCGYEGAFRLMTDGMYQFCQIRKAIGVIEPNNRLEYFGREEEWTN